MIRVPADPDSPTFDDTYTVGFGRWLRSSGDERREWARRRDAAARLARDNQLARIGDAAGEADPVVARCESVKLRRRSIQYGADRQPLTGVTVSMQPGEALATRTTATRVIAGALLAGPAGAVVGAVARKRRGGDQYLVVAGPEFEWHIQVDRGDVDRARRFVSQVNTAARRASAQ